MNRSLLAKLLVEVADGRTSKTAALEMIDRELKKLERECAVSTGSVLNKLYSAHGRTEGQPDMGWTVCLDARVVEIDTGMKSIRLNRDEALALLECLNAALPHMAVKL
jgi:hypothetical protein